MCDRNLGLEDVFGELRLMEGKSRVYERNSPFHLAAVLPLRVSCDASQVETLESVISVAVLPTVVLTNLRKTNRGTKSKIPTRQRITCDDGRSSMASTTHCGPQKSSAGIPRSASGRTWSPLHLHQSGLATSCAILLLVRLFGF